MNCTPFVGARSSIYCVAGQFDAAFSKRPRLHQVSKHDRPRLRLLQGWFSDSSACGGKNAGRGRKRDITDCRACEESQVDVSGGICRLTREVVHRLAAGWIKQTNLSRFPPPYGAQLTRTSCSGSRSRRTVGKPRANHAEPPILFTALSARWADHASPSPLGSSRSRSRVIRSMFSWKTARMSGQAFSR